MNILYLVVSGIAFSPVDGVLTASLNVKGGVDGVPLVGPTGGEPGDFGIAIHTQTTAGKSLSPRAVNNALVTEGVRIMSELGHPSDWDRTYLAGGLTEW